MAKVSSTANYLVYLRQFEPLDDELRMAMLADLNAAERERIERSRSAQVQDKLLQSRWWLRQCLSLQHGELAAHAWPIVHDAQGKPQLAAAYQGPPLQFNVSHSGDYLAIAIATGHDAVGIDIEQIKPQRHWREIAAQYFTAQEQRLLNNQPVSTQVSLFYQLWVLKEALLKAKGYGLTVSLADYDFSDMQLHRLGSNALHPVHRLPESSTQVWQSWLMAPTPQLLLAVTLATAQTSVTWQLVPSSTLADYWRAKR